MNISSIETRETFLNKRFNTAVIVALIFGLITLIITLVWVNIDPQESFKIIPYDFNEEWHLEAIRRSDSDEPCKVKESCDLINAYVFSHRSSWFFSIRATTQTPQDYNDIELDNDGKFAWLFGEEGWWLRSLRTRTDSWICPNGFEGENRTDICDASTILEPFSILLERDDGETEDVFDFVLSRRSEGQTEVMIATGNIDEVDAGLICPELEEGNDAPRFEGPELEEGNDAPREGCTPGAIYTFLGTSLFEGVKNILWPDERDVIWYFRLITMFGTVAIYILYYRKYLVDRHDMDQNPIRKLIFETVDDLDNLKSDWFAWILRIVSLVFLIYIIFSVSSVLLNAMFVRGNAGALVLVPFGVCLSVILGFICVYYFGSLNTYDLLIFGLASIAIGFGWTFVIAEPEWWVRSISFSGTNRASGLVFTLTMFTMGSFLSLIWREITFLLNFLLHNVKQYHPIVEIKDTPFEKIPHISELKWGVYSACMLIALIGIIPTEKNADFLGVPLSTFHAWAAIGGPLVFILTGICGTWYIARRLLPKRFVWVTITILVLDALVAISYISYLLAGQRFGWDMDNTGYFTLFELWMLFTICVWVYGLVMTLLDMIDGLEEDEEGKALYYFDKENGRPNQNGRYNPDVLSNKPLHIIEDNLSKRIDEDNNREVYNQRAIVYYLLGKNDRALADWKEAERLKLPLTKKIKEIRDSLSDSPN